MYAKRDCTENANHASARIEGPATNSLAHGLVERDFVRAVSFTRPPALRSMPMLEKCDEKIRTYSKIVRKHYKLVENIRNYLENIRKCP